MQKVLTVKQKTKITIQVPQRKDILSYYDISSYLDKMIQKDKTDLISIMNCSSFFINEINTALDVSKYFVEIPPELQKILHQGEAYFEKSNKIAGNFTPNIRIKGRRGIQGQITISEDMDIKSITNSISNLSMMAMMQSVFAKLEVINEKLDDIKQGQNNDRIGEVIGAFKSFADLYPLFKCDAEAQQSANKAYTDMQKGLAKIHLNIEELGKELKKAPNNVLKTIKGAFSFYNNAEKYQKKYIEYIKEIQLYIRLILLSDIILQYKGANIMEIKQNHQKIIDYCKDNLNSQFEKDMKYLNHREVTEINDILTLNSSILYNFEKFNEIPLSIEYSNKEIKQHLKHS